MQSDTIVLPVDLLNSGVTTNVTYQKFDAYQNRSSYISTFHTPDSRDNLTLFRTFPKVSGNFKGTRKTAVKFTKDFTVATVDGGTTVSPLIIEVSFSIPLGIPVADQLVCRQRAVAFLDNDTVMVPLNDLQIL